MEISFLRDTLGPSAQLPEEAPEANCNAVRKSSSKKKKEVSNQSSRGAYQCGAKRYCKQMESCEEAMFHLNQCGRKLWKIPNPEINRMNPELRFGISGKGWE